MINTIKQEATARMQKTLDALKITFSKIRTGRANAGLLDHVQVSSYGSLMPLNQVANVTVSDARTLTVIPWDKSMVAAIEKAILTSDLGLNPMSSGATIRVPMPALTEERRKDFIRIVRADGELGRVAIRNIRRDANNELKKAVTAKTISDDDERRGSDLIQKITDQFISELDGLLSDKEKDLMEG